MIETGECMTVAQLHAVGLPVCHRVVLRQFQISHSFYKHVFFSWSMQALHDCQSNVTRSLRTGAQATCVQWRRNDFESTLWSRRHCMGGRSYVVTRICVNNARLLFLIAANSTITRKSLENCCICSVATQRGVRGVQPPPIESSKKFCTVCLQNILPFPCSCVH